MKRVAYCMTQRSCWQIRIYLSIYLSA